MQAYTSCNSVTTPDLDNVPSGLRRLAQWVAWREEYERSRYDERYDRWVGVGKPKKKPYRLTPPHEAASTSDAGTWGTFGDARALVAHAHPHATGGVGFVLTEDDALCCLDFDGCRNPETGVVNPEVERIVRELGCYAEVSPSGTGLHVWIRATKPRQGTKAAIGDGVTVEIYDANQYVTVTGNVFQDGPVRERQEALNALYGRLFPEGGSVADGAYTGRESGFAGTDEELLKRARSANKTGVEFAALYDEGNLSLTNGDRSRADFKLCRMQVWWCGPDAERIDRLFRGSALYRAEKWDEVHRGDGATYGEMTIEAAISCCGSVYRAGRGSGSKTRPGADVLTVCDAVEDEVWRRKAAGDEAFKGKAGNTNFVITLTLTYMARERGVMLPTGCVWVPVSYRELQGRAKRTRPTIVDYARRIKPTRLVRQDAPEKQGLAGAFVLVPPKETSAQTFTIVSTQGRDTHLVDSGKDSRAPVEEIVPLRYSVPGVKRPGTGAEIVVRLLERCGMPLTDKEMEDALGVRARDLRSRTLPDLVAWDVLTATPRADGPRDTYEYGLSPDHAERLQVVREYGGEILQDEAQSAADVWDRAAYELYEAELLHARKPHCAGALRRLTAAQEALQAASVALKDARKAWREFLDDARRSPAPEAADAGEDVDAGCAIVVLYPDSIPSGESFGEPAATRSAASVSHESPACVAADHEDHKESRMDGHEPHKIPPHLAAAVKRDDPTTRDHPDGCGCLGCETLLPDLPRYARVAECGPPGDVVPVDAHPGRITHHARRRATHRQRIEDAKSNTQRLDAARSSRDSRASSTS